MPTICRYKPRRSHARTYTYSDAARVICYAFQGGGGGGIAGAQASVGSGAGLEAALRTISELARGKCGGGAPRGRAAEAAVAAEAQQQFEADALTDAIANVQDNDTLMTEILEWIAAIITALTVLGTALRFIPHPGAKLASVAAIRLLTRVTAFRGAIVARRAANDAVFQRLQQAAEILRRAA